MREPPVLVAKLRSLNVPARAALSLAVLALVLAVFHAAPALTGLVGVCALACGHAGRRPALRRRRPRVEDLRSLVVATAGMTVAVIATVVVALPYIPRLVHP